LLTVSEETGIVKKAQHFADATKVLIDTDKPYLCTR
jgi:hypothetical protein